MSDQEAKQPGPKRCLGALFHSQARAIADKEPVCAGLKRKLRTLPEVLPKESVPAGEFKYVCLGYSVYEKQQQQKKEGGKTPADTVELPYCEGLEVISAAELLKSPAVLNEGAAAASVSGREAIPQEPRMPNPVQPRPGRSFVPGPDFGTEWDNFSERFVKTSKKVVNRMGSNLAFMGRSAKDTLERLSGWRDD